jgi:hypothetical protein
VERHGDDVFELEALRDAAELDRFRRQALLSLDALGE